MVADPGTANAAWALKDILVVGASVVSMLGVIGGALVLASKIGDIKRCIVEAFRDLKGLVRSHKLLLGSLAEESILSAQAVVKVGEPFPGGFEERLGALIATLSPGGNPITEDELTRFKELYKGVNTPLPMLSAEEAFEFYDLARKIANELPLLAKAARLHDPDGKPVTVEQARKDADHLIERAAFILGYCTSEEKKKPETSKVGTHS